MHIINKGDAHFEPLFDRSKSLAKQEQEDFLLAKKLQLDEISNITTFQRVAVRK